MNRPVFIGGRSRRGFTLLEMLVVMGIIGVLAALLFPMLLRAKIQGRDTYCLNNLYQLGLAVEQYAQDYHSYLPVAEDNPSIPPTPPLPRICDLLNSYVGGNSNVFKCPNDLDNWFGKVGSSYEWNALVDGRMIDSPSGRIPFTPAQVWLMADYENVHAGTSTNEATKNVLWADGHASPL